jgi:pyridoxine 5-phosphate synthase
MIPRLGVNIDHVATIRQARGGAEPDPVWAAAIAELAGADGITVHLREDRRHIQDRDVRILRQTVRTRLNLEAALSDEILAIAVDTRPDQVTLVPERREEITTEGGLDVIRHRQRTEQAIRQLVGAGIEVSLFLDPDPAQVAAGIELSPTAIELHTGRYANARGEDLERERMALYLAGKTIHKSGVALHAGHGLNESNVGQVASIAGMAELNIGHAIVSKAVMVGFERAVSDMRRAIAEAIYTRMVIE